MPDEYVLRLEASGEVTRAKPNEVAEVTTEAEPEPEETER